MNTVRRDLAVTPSRQKVWKVVEDTGPATTFHTLPLLQASSIKQTDVRRAPTNGVIWFANISRLFWPLSEIKDIAMRKQSYGRRQGIYSIFIFPFLASEAIFVENIYPLECTDSTCWASIHFLASSTEENSTNAKPRDAPILPRGKKYTRCVNFGWYKFH